MTLGIFTLIPWESVTTIFSVILGAGIAGAGTLWQARIDRKKALAMALADLLETRHRLITFQTMIEELKKHFQVNDEQISIIRNLMSQILPQDPDLHERYSKSVRIIAGVDPLLAYRMRSKDMVSDLMDNINLMTTQNGIPAQGISKFEESLRSFVIPLLDEALLELAQEHSSKLHKDVKKVLNAPKPPELQQWIEEMKRQIESIG